MSFIDSFVDDAKGLICEAIEVEDKFFRSFELLPSIAPINAGAASLRDQASRMFCNREPPPLPTYPPPDNNCEQGYSIRVRFTEKADDGRTRTGENEISVWGPILSYRYTDYTAEDVPQRFDVLAFGSTSRDRLSSPGYSLLASGVYGDPAADKFTVDILSVLPGAGNPNNCGVPLPIPDDYDPYADRDNRTIVYIDADGNSVELNVEATLGFAFYDNDNSISVPVSYTFSPSLSFDPSYKYNVDVVFNLGGKPPTITPPYPTPPPPGQPGAPGPNGKNPNPFLPSNNPAPPTLNPPTAEPPPPVPPDVDTPDEPPPKASYAIIGAIVTTSAIATPTKISTLGQDGNPDVWFPDLGLVSFLISGGASGYGWTEDIRVKNRRQYVPCPSAKGAVSVSGTPRLGVEWTVTPVYGSVGT